jgi:hypothetical protein
MDPPALPERFGRYRVLKPLGQGGMGTVYLAEDTQLGRPVALKVPRFPRGDGGEGVQRFYREARVAATFHHPHLCPVYDVGQIDGIHYLTMPVLQGEPLSARIGRAGRLSQREAAWFACLIARAMEVAHRAGVIHRDLKPANVMVNERGEPVVMDFGLARRDAAPDAVTTGTGAIIGTPAYSPPEQLGSDPAAMGPACDVYSLGVLLYEMLTGRAPFEGSAFGVLRQVLTQEPEPPSRSVSGLDPRLEGVCLKAMAKDPKARFPSMAAVAAALDEILRGHDTPPPSGAGPTTVPAIVPDAQTVVRRRPHRRQVVWGALAGLGAVALGVGGGILFRVRTGNPPADAVQPGSRWLGTFQFLPPIQYGGDLAVTIQERTGDRFRGVYAAGGGTYEWDIEGTVRGNAIRWEFTRVIREQQPAGVVGNAIVEGRCEGDTMDLLFRDATSAAKLKLRLAN